MLIGVAGASGASGPSGTYVGDSGGYPPDVTLSLRHGMLTAFRAGSGDARCSSSTVASTDPYGVVLPKPVPLLGGRSFAFHATGHAVYSEQVSISVTGSLRAAGDVAGTISTQVSNYVSAGNDCHIRVAFDTLAPDSHLIEELPMDDTYGEGFTGNNFEELVGHAGFDYASHRVTEFNAAVDVVCTNNTAYPFVLDSTARNRDPIPVSKSGSFGLSGLALLQGYGYITHYDLVGMITARSARGTLTATVHALADHQTCTTTVPWTAERNRHS